jgi:hypothetical protein
MLLVTTKMFKIALKLFTIIHFTKWKSALVNRELNTVSQDSLLYCTIFEVLTMYII